MPHGCGGGHVVLWGSNADVALMPRGRPIYTSATHRSRLQHDKPYKLLPSIIDSVNQFNQSNSNMI